MMKTLTLILLTLFSNLSYSYTSSCNSTIAEWLVTDRSSLSDVCYTQFLISEGDYYFLKWALHWNNTSNKSLQTVDTWQSASSILPMSIQGNRAGGCQR